MVALTIAGDSGSLRVVSFFANEQWQSSVGTVRQTEFADGTVWNQVTMINRARAASGLGPTTGDDAILGTVNADVIDALAGNDIVYGGAGNDSMEGNDGDDELWGEAGDDTVSGGAGEDLLLGGDGNDVLIGGADSDQLQGGAGADSYHFSSGFGADVVHDTTGTTEDASIDEIVFDATVAAGDVQLSLDPEAPFEHNLLIRNVLTGDQIKVQYFFNAEFGYGGADHIEQIRFSDGTTWNLAEIRARASQVYGTPGADSLQAIGGLDSHIYGLAGNDSLFGGAGNDVLDGGTGNDAMAGARAMTRTSSIPLPTVSPRTRTKGSIPFSRL